MKKFIISLFAAFTFVAFAAPAFAGAPALICTGDSSGACSGRKYCCYEGMNHSDGDKYCKNLGCRRGGTSSCPTAANVSSCGTRDKSSELDLPWCIDPAVARDL